jgi:HEAT repeat protein
MRQVAFTLVVLVLALGTTVSHAQQNFGTTKDVNEAMKFLKSSNPTDRTAGLMSLALLGEDGRVATRDVVGLLFDGSKDVREWANLALPKVNPELAEPVMTLANSQDYDKRMDAMKQLAKLGGDAMPAIPALLKFLDQADPKDRVAVVGTLTQVGAKDPNLSTTLVNLGLRDKDPAVRAAALQGLSKLGNVQAALDMLTKMLKETDPAQRTSAITGLAAIAGTNKDAMQALKASLTDPSPTVRAAAKQAMDKLEKKK